jgi:glycosyltransferase involved in cell wall biosynthesis
LEQLECCIASIADQGLWEVEKVRKAEGVEKLEAVSVEHIVQDGGTEGFADFVKKMRKRWPDRPGYRRVMISEPDGGMYDAINRGLKRGTGRICAYLNCDEQYLPDTLKKVAEAFDENLKVDLFFGDALVLDESGNARCWRKVLVPLVAHTWTCHFSAFTAAMFFRRRLLDNGIYFDTSYRAVADAVWYLEARQGGARVGSLGFVTSTFQEAGENLGMTPMAENERERLTQTAPFWIRIFRPGWSLIHRARRLWAGAHLHKSFRYQAFVGKESKRRTFESEHLRATWPGRMWAY